MFKELELVGSFGMQAARFPAMLQMVEAGLLQPGQLVHGTMPIEDAGAALAAMGVSSPPGIRVIDQW